MTRMHLRGKNNIAKRALIHAAIFNLSLILRQILGVGTARHGADLVAAIYFAFLMLTQVENTTLLAIEPPRLTARLKNRLVTITLHRERKRLLSTGCSPLSRWNECFETRR
jgi:hypothetical protein